MAEILTTDSSYIQRFLLGPAAIIAVFLKDKQKYNEVTAALVLAGFKKPEDCYAMSYDYVFDNDDKFLDAVDVLLNKNFISENSAKTLKAAYQNNKISEPQDKLIPSFVITPERLHDDKLLSGMLTAMNGLHGFKAVRENTGVGTVDFSKKNLDYILSKSPETSVAAFNAYELLGDAYFEDKKFQEAIPQYQKAAEIGESLYYKRPQETAWVYQKLGDTFKNLNQYEDALKAYKSAQSITNDEGYYPTSAKLSEKMAVIFELQGLVDKAQQHRKDAEYFTRQWDRYQMS